MSTCGSGCILGLSQVFAVVFLLIMLICPDRGSIASAFSACTSLGAERVEEDSMGSSQARKLLGTGRSGVARRASFLETIQLWHCLDMRT